MKKLVLATTLFIAGVCNAQKLELGVKLGYVNSTLRFTESDIKESFNSKSNVYVAGSVEYAINPYISVQGEVAMAGLGGENLTINKQKSRLHLTTVFVPIGIKIYPIKNRLSAMGGVNLAFTTKALSEQNGKKVEFKNLNTSNHSFFVGGEYKITKSLLAEVRYNVGLSNIVKVHNQTMKNNFFQIGVGYIFGRL
ncbi:MAG: porin family protein [Flavobacteriaceae bacterium]|nr:porin family protein [Flavobacteriaceae bacterium]